MWQYSSAFGFCFVCLLLSPLCVSLLCYLLFKKMGFSVSRIGSYWRSGFEGKVYRMPLYREYGRPAQAMVVPVFDSMAEDLRTVCIDGKTRRYEWRVTCGGWLQPARSSNLLKRLRFTLDVIGEKARRRVDFKIFGAQLIIDSPDMKSLLEKLGSIGLHKGSPKGKWDQKFLVHTDGLTQAAKSVKELRSYGKFCINMATCYDSLLSASAAATTNIAYASCNLAVRNLKVDNEFSESLLEMGNCLLKKTAMHDDGKSSK
ncbi:hydroxyproline-rich glycoprotein family protein [Striga asiatica]|uniref:Hydroxyproline-rich glycoprotein family protein n=1 Tax=Striga asiatica TaxID=4170 RepID=A0A5A7PIX9_STRAF|nr:hydroxyproline-rich glycoprotein family protein [Striga asiatica]